MAIYFEPYEAHSAVGRGCISDLDCNIADTHHRIGSKKRSTTSYQMVWGIFFMRAALL
jgi:hypothetical protein